jgi:RHS repeat-associated protein
VVASVPQSGPTQINTYDAYGVPGAGNQGRFQFTGQIWLAEVGLYHYKARLYDPWLGRFLQTDPIGYEDQQNWYAYVGNDPVNVIDPSGKVLLRVATCAGSSACRGVATGTLAGAISGANTALHGGSAQEIAVNAIGDGVTAGLIASKGGVSPGDVGRLYAANGAIKSAVNNALQGEGNAGAILGDAIKAAVIEGTSAMVGDKIAEASGMGWTMNDGASAATASQLGTYVNAVTGVDAVGIGANVTGQIIDAQSKAYEFPGEAALGRGEAALAASYPPIREQER